MSSGQRESAQATIYLLKETIYAAFHNNTCLLGRLYQNKKESSRDLCNFPLEMLFVFFFFVFFSFLEEFFF